MAFYRESRPLPDGGTRWSGTDHADTLADAAEAYKRCRKTQYFVLTDESPDLALPCSCCGKPVNDYGDAPQGYRGNKCHYYPSTKRFRIMHYMCAWGSLLGAIGTSYSLAEAARVYEEMAGDTLAV